MQWTGIVFKLLFGNCQRISWRCSWPQWGVRHWRGCSQDIIRSWVLSVNERYLACKIKTNMIVEWKRRWDDVTSEHVVSCSMIHAVARCLCMKCWNYFGTIYSWNLGKRFKVTVNPTVNFFLRYQLSSHVWFHFLHRVLHFAFSFLPKMRMSTVGLPGMTCEESPSSIAFEVLSPDFLFLMRVI